MSLCYSYFRFDPTRLCFTQIELLHLLPVLDLRSPHSMLGLCHAVATAYILNVIWRLFGAALHGMG